MNVFLRWLDQPLAIRAGWILLHSLWQGALIGGFFELARFGLRRRSANARYVAGCAGMVILLAAPVVTCLCMGALGDHRIGIGAHTAGQPATTTSPVFSAGLFAGDAGGYGASPLHMIFAGLDQIAPLLTAAWMAGVILFASKLARSWWWVGNIRSREIEPVDAALLGVLEELRQRLRISRPVRLLESALVEVPTVVGWLRPVILLPAATVAGLTPGQLEAVLAHELAHVRRWDYAVNAFQCAVETLMFYHPVVWWISRCVREERENCCDDVVVRLCGDRLGYARALATLEGMRAEVPQLAFAASGGSLLQRIRRLLGGTDQRPASGEQLAGLALLVTGLVLIGVGVWLNLGPLTYQSVARVRVEPDGTESPPGNNRPFTPGNYDPYFIQTEFEVIQSEVVLYEAVRSLGLGQEWGKKYGDGQPLTTRAAVAMLKKHLNLRPVRNTTLIEIVAASDNPHEAARLANGVAQAYAEFRASQRKRTTEAGIAALENRWVEQQAKIHAAQTNVDDLRRKFNLSESDAQADAPSPFLDSETIRRMEGELVTLQTAQVKIETLYDRLEQLSPEQMREMIPTALGADTELSNLNTEYNAAQERLVLLEKDYATNHPAYVNAEKVVQELDTSIHLRLTGILAGMSAGMAQNSNAIAALQARLDEARKADTERATQSRPYYEAKQRLDELVRFRALLGMKIESEQTEALLPRGADIIDSAAPAAAPSSPNRPRALAIILAGAVIAAFGFFKLRHPPEHGIRPALKTA